MKIEDGEGKALRCVSPRRWDVAAVCGAVVVLSSLPLVGRWFTSTTT